jgi:ParB-like chromosome segregation protein Spo0J
VTSPIQPIRVESILVDARLRKLRESVVVDLMGSIGEVGLIHPLTIRRPNGQYVPHLVAGWHRLEAVRRLGWELVPCCTLDGDDGRAELTEIDENLMRAKLTAAERARHIGRRKELYEALHPETRNGGAPGQGWRRQVPEDGQLGQLRRRHCREDRTRQSQRAA